MGGSLSIIRKYIVMLPLPCSFIMATASTLRFLILLLLLILQTTVATRNLLIAFITVTLPLHYNFKYCFFSADANRVIVF